MYVIDCPQLSLTYLFQYHLQSDIDMEIMVPPIIRVGNRRYRKNPILNKDTETTDQDVTGDTLNCF